MCMRSVFLEVINDAHQTRGCGDQRVRIFFVASYMRAHSIKVKVKVRRASSWNTTPEWLRYGTCSQGTGKWRTNVNNTQWALDVEEAFDAVKVLLQNYCRCELPVIVFAWFKSYSNTYLDKLCRRPPQYAPAPASWPLTLKVVSETRVTWATFVPILVFLGLSVFDLGPMYATDRQTDVRRASSLNAPYHGGGA